MGQSSYIVPAAVVRPQDPDLIESGYEVEALKPRPLTCFLQRTSHAKVWEPCHLHGT